MNNFGRPIRINLLSPTLLLHKHVEERVKTKSSK
jgi:hypothetical protein